VFRYATGDAQKASREVEAASAARATAIEDPEERRKIHAEAMDTFYAEEEEAVAALLECWGVEMPGRDSPAFPDLLRALAKFCCDGIRARGS
jgi:hypothetical protein